MSAIVSIETPKSVVMLTDGAFYDQGNVLLDVRRKVITSEKVPLAICGRGHVGLGDYAARLIMKAIEDFGFDAGIGAAEHILTPFAPLTGNQNFELIVAGISEQHGFRHVQMRTRQGFQFEREFCAISSATSEAGLSDMGIRFRNQGEEFEDYFRHIGPSMFDFYRRCRAKNSLVSERAHFVVGGQLDLTIVSRTGVTVETIHRWDDKVGELINPFADRQTVQAFPGISRQQRRAAERQQRRRVA